MVAICFAWALAVNRVLSRLRDLLLKVALELRLPACATCTTSFSFGADFTAWLLRMEEFRALLMSVIVPWDWETLLVSIRISGSVIEIKIWGKVYRSTALL